MIIMIDFDNNVVYIYENTDWSNIMKKFLLFILLSFFLYSCGPVGPTRKVEITNLSDKDQIVTLMVMGEGEKKLAVKQGQMGVITVNGGYTKNLLDFGYNWQAIGGSGNQWKIIQKKSVITFKNELNKAVTPVVKVWVYDKSKSPDDYDSIPPIAVNELSSSVNSGAEKVERLSYDYLASGINYYSKFELKNEEKGSYTVEVTKHIDVELNGEGKPEEVLNGTVVYKPYL